MINEYIEIKRRLQKLLLRRLVSEKSEYQRLVLAKNATEVERRLR